MPPRNRGSLRIVAIGGGTGLSTVLHGLKEHVRRAFAPPGSEGVISDLCAIVTVTDEGGSSGRLRREFGVLPPGDIRQCLVALSEDEALLSRLFEYRYRHGRGLEGHSLGNLFLAALTEITGDFQHALRVFGEVLTTCGTIYPSTLSNVRLQAEKEVYLHADKELKYGFVVKVMAILKDAGVDKLGMVTDPLEE